MTDQHDNRKAGAGLSSETVAAQALGRIDSVTKALVPAIHPSTTFERDKDGGYSSGRGYTRPHNPKYDEVEELLTTLESGQASLLFTMAAQSLLPGDHVIASRVSTRDRLVALGCMHVAEQLEHMLTEAVRQEIPAHNFLDRLLQAELSGREGRRVKTSLKLSNLPVGQTLENFDFAFQPAIERSRIDTLATCAWVRNAETVLVQGPPGVGKTPLLVGLGIRAVEQGFSVQYFRFDELMTALKADAAVPPTRLKRRKYMSTALLIDELGSDPMTRQEASLFFRLVSHRYGRGAMMITTNKSVRDWTELLAGDEVLTTAILDRLLHRSHVLNIRGRS